MYFKARYDSYNSEIEKSNDTLSIETYNLSIKNVHKLWYEHLMEVQDSKQDVLVMYDLSNHLKVPTPKRNNQSTYKMDLL